MKHWTPDQEAQLQRLMQAKEQAATMLRAEVSAVASAMIATYGYPADAPGSAGIAAESLPAAILGNADALLAVLAPQQARPAAGRRSLGLPLGVAKKRSKYLARIKTAGKYIYGHLRETADEAHMDYIRLRAEHPSMQGAHLRKKQ